jgi:hypothetical protein
MKGPPKGNDYLRVAFFAIAAAAVLALVLLI